MCRARPMNLRVSLTARVTRITKDTDSISFQVMSVFHLHSERQFLCITSRTNFSADCVKENNHEMEINPEATQLQEYSYETK